MDYQPRDDQEFHSWLGTFINNLCENVFKLLMTQVIEGSVPVNGSTNIVERKFSGEMIVILENTGTSTLRFCISGSPTANCNSPRGVEVFPAEIKTVKVEEFGSETSTYLNVTSTSDAVPPVGGNYKITLPNAMVFDIITDAKEVMSKIESTAVKRDHWKMEAEEKNTLKSTFNKNKLRPFVQHDIKANHAYTSAMGKDMGIVAESGAYIDFDTIKPLIELVLKAEGVLVKYLKGIAEGLRIEVDRNDGNGFVLVGVSMHPNFLDTTPLPVAATLWKYRAVYIIKEEMVGQWSDDVKITVIR